MRVRFPVDYLQSSQGAHASSADPDAVQAGVDYVVTLIRECLDTTLSLNPKETERALRKISEQRLEALMWHLSGLDDQGISAALTEVDRRVSDEPSNGTTIASLFPIDAVREWRRVYDLKQFTSPLFGPETAVLAADSIQGTPNTTFWIEARQCDASGWYVKGKIGCGLATLDGEEEMALRVASKDGDLKGVGSHSLLRTGDPGCKDRAVIASQILWYFAECYPDCHPFIPLKPPASVGKSLG